MRITNKQVIKTGLRIIPRAILESTLLSLSLDDLGQAIRAELESNPVIIEIPRKEKPVEKQEDKEAIPKIVEFSADPRLPLSYDIDEEEEIDGRFQAPQISFWERIDVQLDVNFNHDERRKAIAREIIDSLDGRGLLAKPVEKIASDLRVPKEEVEVIRRTIMRTFDPIGVAALDQREVYLAQLVELGQEESLLYKLIDERWDEVKERGLEALLIEAGLDEEQRNECFRILKSLYPFPVEKYSEVNSEYVYPEVIIRIVEGKLVVELVDSGLPRITISSYYARVLEEGKASPEEINFIKEKLRRAEDFLSALEKRRANIQKVAEFIVEYHRDFLLGKKDYLEPITQTRAAELLGIPISTFNRVVKGRYADTPVGIFELKFFFKRGVPRGEAMAPREAVMNMIREMIENEDKDAPLSDQEIADRLERQGYAIKRRTVAEYRKEMGIPNSSKRRRRQ